MVDTPGWYDQHLEEFRKTAFIKSREQYLRLHRQSLEDPAGFWAGAAREYLSWEKEWDSVLRDDWENGKAEWFDGGILNASYNCLDRHLKRNRDKVAYYWEADDPAQSKTVTYGQLYESVVKLASVLKQRGVERGDRVVLYLPMIVELPMAMLACARIGAVHCVVLTGYSAKALAHRIRDCAPKVVITADGAFRRGKLLNIKETVDEALALCPHVDTVVVCKRTELDLELDLNRDVWWHEAVADSALPSAVPPESMGAEDPLFILYASTGTTEAKGLVHTHGGYLLHTAMSTRLDFDAHDNDILWTTPDIGWITGHSYSVYGPLINGLSCVLFEGVPDYPAWDRFWQIVEKYRVNTLYTSPTAIRAIAANGKELIRRHDLSSLRLLASVGQPINRGTWEFYFREVGGGRCPIIDTWWQTESGGHMITPLPGATALKPGSCGVSFFGVDPVILDPDTGEETRFPNQEGILCIKRPWPGMARSIFGDEAGYIDAYFGRVPGMYFTGDTAMRDEHGYYWITGRIDEVVNVSGNRMGTAEIESAIVHNPLVAEAAVVGYPHATKGTGVYAFVTLAKGVEPSDEIRRKLLRCVKTEIGPIATVDAVQWTDALPKTRSGKILRQVLQKIAAGQVDDLGDVSTIADPGVVESLIGKRVKALCAPQ